MPQRQSLLLLGISWALVASACANPIAPAEPVKLELTLGADRVGVTPRFEQGVLSIGTTTIQPWTLPIPNCADCDFSIERRFNPVGPDQILRLHQAGTLRWRLIDSRQPAVRLGDGSEFRLRDQAVEWTDNESSWLITSGESVQWQGCWHHLHWVELPEEHQSRLAKAGDTAGYHWQISTHCPESGSTSPLLN